MSKATYGRGYQFDKARYYVSPVAKPGFIVIDEFKAANGQEQDFIYLSAFEGSLYDTSEEAYILDDAQVADLQLLRVTSSVVLPELSLALVNLRTLPERTQEPLQITVTLELRQIIPPEVKAGDFTISLLSQLLRSL